MPIKISKGKLGMRKKYTICFFDAFGPFPRTRPPEGYFRLTTCNSAEEPLPYIPVLPRYGNRQIPLEYSYDNINWNETDSTQTIYTDEDGELLLRCTLNGNTAVNNVMDEGFHCWKVGENTSVYYKIEGDLRSLLDYKNPDVSMSAYAFRCVFSNRGYSRQPSVNYLNQCIDLNVIVPDGGTDATASLPFSGVFGWHTRRAALWKYGSWSPSTAEGGEWEELFNNNTSTSPEMDAVQINFKSWPVGYGIGDRSFTVRTPASTTFWLPEELPAEYGDNRIPAGCQIARYNVDNYSGDNR